LDQLRREQAEFREVTRALDRENSWMALPALAPAAVVMGLEGAAAIAAGLAGPALKRLPLSLMQRDPYLRVGDNYATRGGRRAHKAFEARLDQKLGWDYEPKIPRPGRRPMKPDGGAPIIKKGDSEKRYFLEFKPNTPSGRLAAARAVKKYEEATRQKVRAIFYNPKDYQ
jgi:hypothetical protein